MAATADVTKYYAFDYARLCSLRDTLAKKGATAVSEQNETEAERLREKYRIVNREIVRRERDPLFKKCGRCKGTGYLEMYDRNDNGRCHGCGGSGTVKNVMICVRCGELSKDTEGNTICWKCWTPEDDAARVADGDFLF